MVRSVQRLTEAATSRESAWVAHAEVAEESMARLPYGRRQDSLAEAANEIGVSPQYLRRARAVHEFSKSFGPVLRTFSLPVAEAVKRWSQYDHAGATDAARRVSSGALSLPALIRAEGRARAKQRASVPGGKQEKRAYVAKVAQWLCEYRKELQPYRVITAADREREHPYTPSADLYFVDGERIAAAVIIAPVGRNAPSQLRECGNIVVRALALHMIFGRSFVVYRNDDIHDLCKRWRQENSSLKGSFELFSCPED